MNKNKTIINIDEWTGILVKCMDDKVIIKGKSGVGKSTLLRSLKLHYKEKSILIDNKSFIFEGTIEENILVGRELKNDLSNYLNLLFTEEPKLKDKKTKISIETLSSGQIQRISLLRDIINSEGKIVMIDEPTSALDSKTEKKVTDLFNLYAKEMGIKKLIITTHSNQIEKDLIGSKVVNLYN